MGVTPSLRVVVSGADLDAWARLKSAIVPNEPVTAEQIRATDEEDRLLLLADSTATWPAVASLPARISRAGASLRRVYCPTSVDAASGPRSCSPLPTTFAPSAERS